MRNGAICATALILDSTERATRHGFEVFGRDSAEVQRDYHSLGTAFCPVVRTRIRIASILKTPPARCGWAQQRPRRFREDSTGYPLKAPKERAIVRKLLKNGNETGR
jgi:hypothetical protein